MRKPPTFPIEAIQRSAKAQTKDGGHLPPAWTQVTRRPELFSPNPTTRPHPPAFNVAEALSQAVDLKAKYHSLVQPATICLEGDAASNPYHIDNWQPATIYPTNSERPFYLLLYGSHHMLLARTFVQMWDVVKRATELETWRSRGGEMLFPLRKVIRLEYCIPLTLATARPAQSVHTKDRSRLHCAEYINRQTLRFYVGADIMPAPETSQFTEGEHYGELVQPVSRSFAQRWSHGGYVYPEAEDPVLLNVGLCIYWGKMVKHDRATRLTNREHSMLAAYYAIPKLHRLTPDTIQHHPQAPYYG